MRSFIISCLWVLYGYVYCYGIEERPLKLNDVVRKALESNYSLVLTQEDTAITKEQEEIRDAAFDPTVTLGSRYGETQSPLAGNLSKVARPYLTSGTNYSAKVSQEIKGTGTDVSLSSLLNDSKTRDPSDTVNPDIGSEVSIAVTQPLLNGRGEVNLAPLMRARAQTRIAYLQLQQEIMDLLLATENAYWQLSAETERLVLRQSSKQLAETLLQETQNRYELGLATESEVLQAKAQLATQQEAIAGNLQTLENSTDTLLQLMGSLTRDTKASLSTDALPSSLPQPPEFPAFLDRALFVNEEYRIRSEEIGIQELNAKIAKNEMLPDLNLSLGGSLLGRDNRYANAMDNASGGDAYRWSSGLELTFPWGRRAGIAEHRVAMKRVDRAKIVLEQTRMGILLNARSVWRAFDTNLIRYRSAEANLIYTQEAYKQERARYKEGLASFRDVLQAQRDLDTSRQRELDGRLSVLKSKTTLARLDGSLLTENGMTWRELNAESPQP